MDHWLIINVPFDLQSTTNRHSMNYYGNLVKRSSLDHYQSKANEPHYSIIIKKCLNKNYNKNNKLKTRKFKTTTTTTTKHTKLNKQNNTQTKKQHKKMVTPTRTLNNTRGGSGFLGLVGIS